MKALCIVLLAWGVARPALAFDPAGLLGTWRYEKDTFIASGVIYTIFSQGGLCIQVAKVSIAGTTQWATNRCSWTVAQSVLSIKVTGSVTTPKNVGTLTSVTLDSLSSDAFSISKDGDRQEWTRAQGVPEEYEVKLALERAAGASD